MKNHPLFTLLLALIPWAGGEPSAPDGARRLEHEIGWSGSLEHSFGRVLAGSRLEHTFKLTSSSNVPRRLVHVKASCSCTTSTPMLVRHASTVPVECLPADGIAPGDAIELTCVVDTAGKQGSMEIPVWLEFADKSRPLRLLLKAEAVPLWSLSQTTLNLGTLTAGSAGEGKLTVTSSVHPSSRLMLAEELPEGLECRLRPEQADADGFSASWQIDLSYSAPQRLEEGRRILPIRLQGEGRGRPAFPGAPSRAEFRAFVELQIVLPVYASPDYLSFGVVDPAVGAEIEFRVHTTLGRPLQVPSGEDVRFSGTLGGRALEEHAAVTFSRSGDDLLARVVLGGLPADTSGAFRGELVLPLGLEQLNELRLPLFGLVRRP